MDAGPRRHSRQRKSRTEAKKAKGLRKIRKRNNKVLEVNTKYIALPAHEIKLLQKYIRTALNKSALAEWEEWETGTKGRHLRLLVNAPTRDILEITQGLDKQLSSLVVQMRTSKIGLPKICEGSPGLRTRGANGASHSVNVPKVSSGKKEHMERRGERIRMAQHHPKVHADITQIRPQSSDLYEEIQAYWDSLRLEKEKKKKNPILW